MSWNMYVLQIRTFMELFHTNEPLNVKIGLNFVSLQWYTIYISYILRPFQLILHFSLKLFYFLLLLIQESIVYQSSSPSRKENSIQLFISFHFYLFFFTTQFSTTTGENLKILCFPGRIYLCFYVFYVSFLPRDVNK